MKKFIFLLTVFFISHSLALSADILHPKRNTKPDKLKDRVKQMRMPTGYFKVIYRPAMDNEPAHAIGFLLPHSFEDLNMLSDSYAFLSPTTAYWAFISRIDLIEERSGIIFPGIPDAIKSVWGDEWFLHHAHSRDDLRATSCGQGTPKGAMPNSTKADAWQLAPIC